MPEGIDILPEDQIPTTKNATKGESERARIARDLHDDLGSSLARISLLSELVKEDKDNPQQVLLHVTKIAPGPNSLFAVLYNVVDEPL